MADGGPGDPRRTDQWSGRGRLSGHGRGGPDDAWAPLESAREVASLLPETTVFRSFPGGRHSIFRDAPESYEELRLFLDSVRAAEGLA